MYEAIKHFLKPPDEGGAYTPERLAMLLAHACEGKLAYHSCCCFAGVPTAHHALQEDMECEQIASLYQEGHERSDHSQLQAMSSAFFYLGEEDAERRAKLIPLIHEEIQRREAQNAKTQDSFSALEEVSV